MRKVGIVMGSDSDMPVAEKAIERLEGYGIPYEVHIYSAHRTPEQAKKFAEEAEANGFGAIIALAGKAAHLAGALAATGAMGLSVSDMEEALRIRMKPKLLEMNMKALHMGAECVTER